jgi:hypothetical protein
LRQKEVQDLRISAEICVQLRALCGKNLLFFLG